MSGFAAGFLQGLGDAKEKKNDREERAANRSLMEAYVNSRGREGQGGAAGGPVSHETFTYDGKISDRGGHAFERFRSAGLPDHVSAGLVGNLMQESGVDINPAAVGDGGNAFGAAQHNGPRKVALFEFAKARGAQPTDFDTQIDFILHEGQTSEKGAWSRIMATKTPEEAATVASQHFWRPGVPHNERRASYAASVYGNRRASPTEAPAIPQPEPTDWQWFRNRRAS